jgi:hypothetical protein
MSTATEFLPRRQRRHAQLVPLMPSRKLRLSRRARNAAAAGESQLLVVMRAWCTHYNRTHAYVRLRSLLIIVCGFAAWASSLPQLQTALTTIGACTLGSFLLWRRPLRLELLERHRPAPDDLLLAIATAPEVSLTDKTTIARELRRYGFVPMEALFRIAAPPAAARQPGALALLRSSTPHDTSKN